MNKIKIEGKPVNMPDNWLGPVTYVPSHAEGNAGHPDCEQGVIISVTQGIFSENKTGLVGVLYCKSRTVQQTNPDDLVWG